ncbi:MAG TPA: hypothetical protein QF611_13895, partial [Pseudomonadales bacterium]|nr:hypothetical protein [Pseudomonadales bacterium]
GRKMDHRLYFVLGDLFANLLVGAVSGWLCWLIVDPGWNMWVAMILMMALCMFMSILLWLPFSVVLGVMEAMVPFMLTGMLSGMVVGMWLTRELLDASSSFSIGAVCGLVSIVFIWILNSALRGTEPARWR